MAEIVNDSMTNQDRIYFIKVREVKSPTRGTEQSAGFDFYLPKFTEDFITRFKELNTSWWYRLNDNSLSILPGHRLLIPSGIKVFIENRNSALIAANKSGLSTKHGLQFTAQVVDSDYRGEVHIGILNSGETQVTFNSGDKLIQFLHTPIILSNMLEVDELNWVKLIAKDNSNRGEGGFGSTGR